MKDKIKNGIIAFLICVIVALVVLIFTLDSGRYCRPIIPDTPVQKDTVSNWSVD